MNRWAQNREGREAVRQKWSGAWSCIPLNRSSGRLSDLGPRVRVLGQPHLGADWWRLLMCDAHRWEGFPGTVLESVYVHIIPKKNALRNREMIKCVIALLEELYLNNQHRDVAPMKASANTK